MFYAAVMAAFVVTGIMGYLLAKEQVQVPLGRPAVERALGWIILVCAIGGVYKWGMLLFVSPRPWYQFW